MACSLGMCSCGLLGCKTGHSHGLNMSWRNIPLTSVGGIGALGSIVVHLDRTEGIKSIVGNCWVLVVLLTFTSPVVPE